MWGLQALLTTRKGKKRFAMYDLTVTLTWQGLWVEDDKKQVCNVCTLRITNELPPCTMHAHPGETPCILCKSDV